MEAKRIFCHVSFCGLLRSFAKLNKSSEYLSWNREFVQKTEKLLPPPTHTQNSIRNWQPQEVASPQPSRPPPPNLEKHAGIRDSGSLLMNGRGGGFSWGRLIYICEYLQNFMSRKLSMQGRVLFILQDFQLFINISVFFSNWPHESGLLIVL
jgi:hypothetical protein